MPDVEMWLAAREYILEAIKSFKKDPPDTDFQKGYLAALKTVAKEAFHIQTV